MAHCVVRTDNMYGTDVRAGLVSVEYFVTTGEGASATDTPTAIDNGNVLKLDGLLPGEREIFKGVAPAANTPLNEIVLVDSPEVDYDERKRNLEDYENAAGKACRGYRLHTGDVFGLTKDGLDGAAAPAVGDVVELKAGTKFNVVAAATGATEGSTVVGKIEAIETAGRHTFYVIRVA